MRLSNVTSAIVALSLWVLVAGAAMAEGFEPVRIAEHREPTAVEIGPDGHLYVLSVGRRSSDARSRFTRYRLDEDGEPTGEVDLLHAWAHRGERENDGERPLGIAFDPGATGDQLVAWITINRDPLDDRWGGRLVRAEIPPVGEEASVEFADWIINLPVGFHEVNQLAFRPDGRLYLCVGSTTTSGAPAGGIAGAGGAEFPEAPLSAAILEIELEHIDPPLDVQTGEGGTYNPFAADAPVRPYASGIRQVYDVVWHEGRLYGSVNQNDVSGRTGSCDGVPDLDNQTPPEFLAIFKRGHTYGFPNASRGECVLMGGRPTEDSNAWYHVQAYPPGVEPHPGFDPDLLHPIGDRYGDPEWDIGGGSANGIIAYRAPGPHQGHLMQAFFGGQGRGRIWAFVPGPDGRIVDRYPLRDPDGEEIRIPDNLDLTQHPNGNLYVARYGDQATPDNGELWLLRPAQRHGQAELAEADAIAPQAREDRPAPAARPGRPLVRAGSSEHLTVEPDAFPLEVALNGSVEAAGETETHWTLDEPSETLTFADAADPRTTVTVAEYGTYVLHLAGRNAAGYSRDLVTITVDQPGNEPPTVEARPQRTRLRVGQTLEVEGVAHDDGLPNPPGELRYRWTQVGPGEGAATFADPTSPRTTVGFTNPDTYTLRLVVSDGVYVVWDEFRVEVSPRE